MIEAAEMQFCQPRAQKGEISSLFSHSQEGSIGHDWERVCWIWEQQEHLFPFEFMKA